jgi:heterodisulfide reductase subunit C
MKATALWLEDKGYVPKSPAHVFDEEFSRQVIERGKIEDTEVLHKFLSKTKQPLVQDWLVAIMWGIARRLPVKWGIKTALAQVFKPKARRWKKVRSAISDYIYEEDEMRRQKLQTIAAARTPQKPQTHLEAAE